jgi:solute carrier family 25 folate transporter 32
VPSWTITFSAYGALLARLRESGALGAHPTLASMAAAVGAGAANAVLTNPLWLVKVRLQTQAGAGQYEGIAHAFQTIWREEGARAFSKGLGASLLGLAHIGIYFPLYEAAKRRMAARNRTQWARLAAAGRGGGLRARQHITGENLTALQLAGASVASKCVASALTYPHEVLRARLQRARGAVALREAARAMWRAEGPRAFYQGFGTNLLRTLPASAISFVTFEFVFAALTGGAARVRDRL